MTPLNVIGIANGYKVDATVWRGAQPEDSAWPLLAAAGCKRVIDLNNTGVAAARQCALARAVGLDFWSLDWSGILAPSQRKIEVALHLIDDQPSPVFVHCLHGSDRTGTLCAIWRMHHDGLDFDDAMAEAFTSLGFQGMHEFWMAAAVAQYAHDMSS